MTNESKHMFDEGPLREAMIIYLSMNYEEAADYSEDSMIAEYNYLKGNGQLHLIFEAVQIIQSQSKMVG